MNRHMCLLIDSQMCLILLTPDPSDLNAICAYWLSQKCDGKARIQMISRNRNTLESVCRRENLFKNWKVTGHGQTVKETAGGGGYSWVPVGRLR